MVAAVSVLLIVFMAVFFVKICGEASRVKVCEVLQLDTEPCAPPAIALQTSSNVVVMAGTPDDSLKVQRGRKPA